VQTILYVLVGIVAFDALLVVGLAATVSLSDAVHRHRHNLDGRHVFGRSRPYPPLRLATLPTARPLAARLAAASVVVTVVFAGTALATPGGRQFAGSVWGTVARELHLVPVVQERRAAAEGGGGSATGVTAHHRAPGRRIATSRPRGTSLSPVAHQVDRPSRTLAPTAIAPTVPSPPGTVIAVAASSAEIDLAWANVGYQTAYRIQRSPDGAGGWTTIAATGQGVTGYSDLGLASATTYYYRVLSTNGGGRSSPSDVASSTTSPVPVTPDGLTAVAVSSGEIDLTWTDGATESGYSIERSADGSTGWAAIATTGQDVTTYDDLGLVSGTTYYYRVLAMDSGGGASAPSLITSATTLADSATPPSTDPASAQADTSQP
jgi:hypothetical protein